jgi:hypothetical protein
VTLDVADAVDDLRQLIARADALVIAAEDMFNNPSWSMAWRPAAGWSV